jgi:peptidoglycan/LPS O-acetylase OafA/YrhL
VAAVLVVVGHSVDNPAWRFFADRLFDTGRLGVTLFFLVSGFIIPSTLERNGSIRAFAINRFFRLYPLYWLSVGVIFLWIELHVPLDNAYYSIFERHLARNILTNLTMLQELLRVPDAIPLYWTLALELLFYLACALLFRANYLRFSLRTAWLVTVLTLLVAIAVPSFTHHRAPFEHIYAFVAFFAGTAVYRHLEGSVSSAQLRQLMFGTIGTALIGVAFNYFFFTDPSEHIGPLAASLGYLAAYAAFFAAYANRSATFPKPLLWVGVVSYSVYLLHPLVIEVAVGAFGEMARLLVGLPATIALSFLTYRFVEAPAIALGHRVAARFERVPVRRI